MMRRLDMRGSRWIVGQRGLTTEDYCGSKVGLGRLVNDRQKAMTNCVMGLEPGCCRKYFAPIFKREIRMVHRCAIEHSILKLDWVRLACHGKSVSNL